MRLFSFCKREKDSPGENSSKLEKPQALIALERFELPSLAPKARMLGHYTTGLLTRILLWEGFKVFGWKSVKWRDLMSLLCFALAEKRPEKLRVFFYLFEIVHLPCYWNRIVWKVLEYFYLYSVSP